MSQATGAPNPGEGSSSQMPFIHPGNGSAADAAASAAGGKKKRKNHRAGKKRKGQKRATEAGESAMDRARPSQSGDRPAFYRAYQSDNLNLSGTSLDSDALLDHRCELCPSMADSSFAMANN